MATDGETRTVGWKLARRVADSDLYDQLNDQELAECHELIARGNSSEGPPDRQSPLGVSCRLARCQYQADCTRIQYCQSVIFESKNLPRFIHTDLLPTLKRVIAAIESGEESEKQRSELSALVQRVMRTV